MKNAPISYDKWGCCGKYFEWRDHHVFFQRGGHGKVILLLHGFLTSGWSWSWISQQLIEDYHMIVPDLLDYGMSRNFSGKPCSLIDQANMIEALMAERGVREVHIMAQNIGGSIAQELIARQNESSLGFRIKSVIFLNSSLFPELYKPRSIQELLAGRFASIFAHLVSKRKLLQALMSLLGPATQPNKAQKAEFARAIEGVNGRPSLPRRIRYVAERRQMADRWVSAIRTTHIPMMLINGSSDPVAGSCVADLFEKEIPAGKLARLPGVGHFPQIEAPETVLELTHQFHGCVRRSTDARLFKEK